MDNELWGKPDSTYEKKGSSYSSPEYSQDHRKYASKKNYITYSALTIVLCIVLSALSGGVASFFVVNKLSAYETSEPALQSDSIFMPSELDTANLPLQDATISEATTSEPPTFEPSTNSAPISVSSQQTENTTVQAAKTKGEVYAESVNSIVGITSKRRESYQTFFGYSSTQEVTSTGSGFFVTETGYILTNYHVIEDSYEITVTTYDGTTHPAEVRGYEPSNDIAIIKIEGSFEPVTIGSSSSLQVGDDILVIGNALGELSYTFTDGVVSYLNRKITTDSGAVINMFQTNAAINEGNSGGPVYNMEGEVVGIASAKYASASVEGLGFCIPVDDIMPLTNDIVSFGYVTGKASMGVSLQSVTQSLAVRYSLPVGCYVVTVGTNTGAEKAGIVKGDVITAIDGVEIDSCDDLFEILSTKKAGESATLKISRQGTKLDVTVVFDEYIPAPARTQYSNVFDY